MNPYSAPETDTAVQYSGAQSGALVVRVFSLLMSIVGAIIISAFLVGLLKAAVARLILALIHVIVGVLPTAIIGCFVRPAVFRDTATQREVTWFTCVPSQFTAFVTIFKGSSCL